MVVSRPLTGGLSREARHNIEVEQALAIGNMLLLAGRGLAPAPKQQALVRLGNQTRCFPGSMAARTIRLLRGSPELYSATPLRQIAGQPYGTPKRRHR